MNFFGGPASEEERKRIAEKQEKLVDMFAPIFDYIKENQISCIVIDGDYAKIYDIKSVVPTRESYEQMKELSQKIADGTIDDYFEEKMQELLDNHREMAKKIKNIDVN